MSFSKLFIALAVALNVTPTWARITQPSDVDYSAFTRAQTRYFFPTENRDIAVPISLLHENFKNLYDHSFQWRLDERQDLILLSEHNQVANAYATISPNVKTAWYPAGAEVLENFAASSWAFMLDAHETAHLYQLNAKGNLNAKLKSIFGNAIFLSPYFLPVLHPNVLLPTSILEGNAVLNESRVLRGGRLHSGEVRAQVLAMVQAGDVDTSRLINDEFKYPFGTAAYIQGGYFQAHLATKYGIEKTNSFFKAHGEHYLNPLILNKTFRNHFGQSFAQEMRESLRQLQLLAQRQVSSVGTNVSQTMLVERLNHDANSIWWVESNGYEPTTLKKFNKATQAVEAQQIDLRFGKVFFADDRPLVASSDQHNLFSRESSLYGESSRLEPAFRGQIVTDQRAGHSVALDAKNSWLDPQMLLDGEPYDIAHSHPILDDQGHTYYFRQNGEQRLLFKDRQPMFRFEGYYSKLTEVSADGNIYFIGNTDFGSTLYCYCKQELQRVLPSDKVVDARRISATEFLAVEIESRGHRVVVTQANPKSQAPVNYRYGFAQENVEPQKDELPVESVDYHAGSEMRFSSLDLGFGANANGAQALVNGYFADPLELQSLSAGAAAGFGRGGQDAQIQYGYSRWLPKLYLQYNYYGSSINKHQVIFGANTAVLRKRRWDANIDLAVGMTGDTSILLTRANLSNIVPAPVGYFNWREFNASLLHRQEAVQNNFSRREDASVAQVSYLRGFVNQFYGAAYGAVAWSSDNWITVTQAPSPFATTGVVPRLSSIATYDVNFAATARAEVHKVLELQAYSTRVPIGVNRLALIGAAQAMSLRGRARDQIPSFIGEAGYGVEIEFLLLHRAPARFRLLNATTSGGEKVQNALQMSLQHSF